MSAFRQALHLLYGIIKAACATNRCRNPEQSEALRSRLVTWNGKESRCTTEALIAKLYEFDYE